MLKYSLRVGIVPTNRCVCGEDMFDKQFFENYVGQEISLDISGDDKPYWVTGKVTKITEEYFFFELTTGSRIGTTKTLLYASVKEVDLPVVKNDG